MKSFVDLLAHGHLNNMKLLLALYILLIVSNTNAQDTLYLPVHGLGHEKYVLKDDGSFIFSSYLCGSSFVSFGNYKRTFNGYKFKYDTTKCPSPNITEVNKKTINDSMTLFFHNMVDNIRQPYFDTLTIGEVQYICNHDSDSITIPKKSLNSNVLTITYLADTLVFTIDTSSSELHIYLSPIGMGYNCGVKDIRKLKKTKRGYLNKFVVYDENKEKPWKKGTKRVVRQYYQLKQKNDKHNIN
jgi:hypothetical protein